MILGVVSALNHKALDGFQILPTHPLGHMVSTLLSGHQAIQYKHRLGVIQRRVNESLWDAILINHVILCYNIIICIMCYVLT